MVPHLLRRIEIRGVGRKLLHTDGIAMTPEILRDRSGLVDAPAVKDKHNSSPQMPSDLSQETDDIFATDVAALNAPVQTKATSPWRHANGSDDRKPIVGFPLMLDRGLPLGRPCPSYEGLQHKSALVEENNATTVSSRVFLYGATSPCAIVGFSSRPFLWHAARAFDNSTSTHAESSTRVLGDTARRSSSRSPRPHASTSKDRCGSREPLAPSAKAPKASPFAQRKGGTVVPDEVSPPTPPSRVFSPPPSKAPRKMASTPQAEPPLEYQDPFPEGIPPIVAELLTPPHFSWVSCNKLYDRSLGYASINNGLLPYKRRLPVRLLFS